MCPEVVVERAKMVNERQPPRRDFRQSILPEENRLNEDGMPESLLNIENMTQLRYWIQRDPDAVIRSLADVKKNLTETTDDYNRLAEEHDESVQRNRDETRALRDELSRLRVAQSIETGENTGLRPKSERSPKLPDPPMFSDNKEPDIDEWISAMRNKFQANGDWYPLDENKLTYTRSRLTGDAMKHLKSRFRQNSPKPFTSAEEIFEALDVIYGDSNRRINAMKAFRRLKQTGPFRVFAAFWAEFQRLASDAEIFDTGILLEDLRDKMSYELQKALVLETGSNLYEFAKKAQHTDQILRDLSDKKINAGSGYASYAPAYRSNNVATPPDQPRQVTPAFAPRQATPAVVVPQVNTVQCFNCKGYGHISRDCRMPRNRELNVRNIEEENEGGSDREGSGKE